MNETQPEMNLQTVACKCGVLYRIRASHVGCVSYFCPSEGRVKCRLPSENVAFNSYHITTVYILTLQHIQYKKEQA